MKRLRIGLFTLISLMCLAGCQKETPGPITAGTQSETENMYINDFILLQFEDSGGGYQASSLFYDTYGSKLYLLQVCPEEKSAMGHLSLYVFDGNTREMTLFPFALQVPDRENSSVRSMDVRSGPRLSFRLHDDEGDFLVITDMEGNILLSQDPFPEQDEYPWNEDVQQRYANRAYDGEDGSAILSRCHDQENVTELFSYDTENGKETPLTVFDGELVRSLCMDGPETMYYTTLESLNKWDRSSNTRTRLLDLHANGISASPTSGNLLVNSKGELLVCELESEIPGIFVLSKEKTQKEDGLRMVYLTQTGASTLSRPTQMFSMVHPELEIVQELCENETERSAIRDRSFIELATGNGPELMWVLEEDMYDLYEKGLLMDMSELISDDIREQIVPGVIQSGTIDDKLVGMKLYVVYETILVSDALWEKDSWTPEDVIKILESGEDWEFTFSYFLEGMDPYQLLSKVFLTDLEESGFLDLEQGYCNFNCPEFIKLLEICKKYADADYTGRSREEQATQLKNGDGIAEVMCFVDGILAYSAWMNRYEGSAHMVGFPTQEGGRNYILSDNTYLVVSARAEHLEEIKELLAYLLSYENQFDRSYMSVRKDVIRDCVEKSGENQYRLKVSATGDTYMELDTKPDGTTWLEDYLSFIETCEPAPSWRYTPVGAIISEEVQPYFVGDKSAKEVAEIIQSRVQLYLDESR